jgi:xylan 1,4-beta-xylosidase
MKRPKASFLVCLLGCLIVVAILPFHSLRARADSAVRVDVDLRASEGPFVPIQTWFGYDEPNYTYTANGKKLLSELQQMSPAPVRVRTHNLLTTGDGQADLKWGSTDAYTEKPDGKAVYEWSVVDKIFDAYAAAGVQPMVEIGFMPEAMSIHPQPYHVQFPADIFQGGWSYPPKDYQRWGELVEHLAQHLGERYGKHQAEQWYWEVWNEPDIGYWHGSTEDYLKLYDAAVRGVRRALPGAQVGGPAITSPHNERAAKFLTDFLDHCAKVRDQSTAGAVPLDFISFHVKGRPELSEGHVRMGLDRELAAAADGFAIVRRYPEFAKLPIILSEADPEGCAACSAQVNPQNAYRNGPLYASYTAAAMKGLLELQDRSGVNLAGMLTWAFEFEGRNYFEGFRTLATNGVDKPVLNFFRMAGMMSGDRVHTKSSGAVALDDIEKSGVRQTDDIDAFATTNSHEAAVMVWNYFDDDVAAAPALVNVNISGLPASAHRVRLSHYRIDDSHSNAWTVWKSMGKPEQPTPEQYAKLQAAGQLSLLSPAGWLKVKGGEAKISVTLPRQAISLLRLSW